MQNKNIYQDECVFCHAGEDHVELLDADIYSDDDDYIEATVDIVNKNILHLYINYATYVDTDNIKIAYCPVCGRKLTDKGNKDGY